MERKPRSNTRRLSRAAKAIAWLGVVLVFVLTVLAVSPAAHEFLHNDAGEPDHSCAVTLYAHGVTAAVTALLLAVMVWRLASDVALWRSVEIKAPAFVLPPGCGPPTV